MTPQLRSGIIQAVFFGLAAASLVFGGAQPVGAASPLQATAPTLGQASSFAVLAGSTVTNTGASTILADLGVSPGTAVTGFPPGLVVNGTIHAADALAGQAQAATTTVYNTLAGEACTQDLSGQDLGLQPPLAPGVYCFTSSAQLTGTLTLNATGNGVYVFKIGSTLTTASNSRVNLIGPAASECNVFWQVTSSATLGTGTEFVGNIIALTSISLTTGAHIAGRALARNGAVTLNTNTIGSRTCAVGTSTATATATATAAPQPAPWRPSKPAATVTPPTPTPTLSAASATAISAAATGTVNAISAATATAISAATTATAITAAAGAAAAAPATPTATPASAANVAAAGAVTAPAAEVQTAPNVPAPALTPVPTATRPSPGIPTTLPRTGGGGLPPVGILSLLLGGLAVALAMTVRRTRK